MSHANIKSLFGNLYLLIPFQRAAIVALKLLDLFAYGTQSNQFYLNLQ